MNRIMTLTACCLIASGSQAATYHLTGADVANNAIGLSQNYVFAQILSDNFVWDGSSSFSVGNVVLDSDGLVDLEFIIEGTWTADYFSFDAGNSYSLSETNGACPGGGFFCGNTGSVRADVLGVPASITLTASGFTWDSGATAAFGNRLILNFSEVSVVPVPAAVWLLGSAVAGLGILRRRQAA